MVSKNKIIYYNFSGGAKGSDIGWESIGNIYGVKTIAFSFKGHRSLSPNTKILTNDELDEGWNNVLESAKHMKRYINRVSPYIKNLLSRNWFQVKYSDSIFAIGKILKPGDIGVKYRNSSDIEVVDGGTGYAVMMAIIKEKPVYIFDQYENEWFKWKNKKFEKTDTPLLSIRFAGIGTRELNENGTKAIKSVYKKTFQ